MTKRGTMMARVSRLGERLDSLRLVRVLGEGGMGTVYEAVEVTIGRRRAVKVLHSELAHNPTIYRRFLREARIAASLRGEFFVPVSAFGFTRDRTPYLVMDLLEGRDLGALLSDEARISPPRLLNLMGQACKGLSVAHEHDPPIVHRDLKPENLFVCGHGDTESLKILDFGIAKLLDSNAEGPSTHTGSAVGTPHYMSPEQARGSKAIDPRTDVYALGVILYEGLSGKKPHPGESYNEILSHILTQEPEPLAALRPDLPASLVAIVHRAMSYDLARRFRSAMELARELEHHEAQARALGRDEAWLRSARPAQVPAAATLAPALADTALGESSVSPSLHSVALTVTGAAIGANRMRRLALTYAAMGALAGAVVSFLSLARSRGMVTEPVPVTSSSLTIRSSSAAVSARATPAPVSSTDLLDPAPPATPSTFREPGASRLPSQSAAPDRERPAAVAAARAHVGPTAGAEPLVAPHPGAELHPPSRRGDIDRDIDQ